MKQIPQELRFGSRQFIMSNSLVIQSTISEVRVALLEDSSPVEVYIERKAERGVVGNVYRGRVVRVLPGMQAGSSPSSRGSACRACSCSIVS